jgi:hypothetical protein
LKYFRLFLTAALTVLVLTAFYLLFLPLDRSTALAPVEGQDAALQNPTVRIDPAESVVRPSEGFTVSVMIDQATNLGGFEFALLFITTTVTVENVNVVEGGFPGSTGRQVFAVVSRIDNQAGKAEFGVVTVGSAPGASGTGVLATVALNAQGSGESPLDLQNVQVVETNGHPQTTTVEDGLVRIGFAIYLPMILKAW